MNNTIELRLPFLDKDLVEYALRIPARLKLDGKQNKIILRKIALKLGLDEEFTERKKRAAQYGSKFDKAIMKLARKNRFKNKSDYLNQFLNKEIMRLGVLWSSGKDSAYAAYTMIRQNYDIACIITIKSSNKDSYMYHTPNVEIARLHADAMNIPLVEQDTSGEKEKELSDLKKALKIAKNKHRIEGVVTGALYSNYQRERVEKVADGLKLKIFSPLWHINQETEMRQLLNEGFEIIFSSVAAEGLDKSWLGRKITENDVDSLVKLNKKFGVNIAGEGGEFESLVIDCPMFKKKIKITDAEIKEESKNAARFIIKDANLSEK